MKLPSIQQMGRELRRITVRFPLVVLDTVLFTVLSLILLERESQAGSDFCLNLLLTTILGFPLLLGIALLAERKELKRPIQLLLHAGGALLLLVYYLTLPIPLEGEAALHIVRFLMLAVTLLLFLAVAPFAGSGEENGFWHYVKVLVIRAITAFFYGGVLQAGFSLALAALDQLFGIDIPLKRHSELWVLLTGLFATSFFLAGVPEKLHELEKSDAYPRGLRVFAQYILSSVLLVYLVILYAYMVKIVVAWSWPKGFVSALIIGFAATGIATLLLLWPIRMQEDNRWGRLVSRWFFPALLPCTLVLFLAVWRRVSEYGITISRYLGLALALYLLIIVLYYIFSQKKNIMVIPALLGLFSLGISLGPWGAFSVSSHSQTKRLEKLLTDNKVLVEGKIQKVTTPLSQEAALQISSIIGYLHEMHGYGSIQSWFEQNLTEKKKARIESKSPTDVTAMMGIEYMRGARFVAGDQAILRTKWNERIEIRGYDWLRSGNFFSSEESTHEIIPGELNLQAGAELHTLTLVALQGGKGVDSLRFDMGEIIRSLHEQYGLTNPEDIPVTSAAATATGARLRAKIYLRRVNLELKDGGIKPVDYTVDLLYTISGQE